MIKMGTRALASQEIPHTSATMIPSGSSATLRTTHKAQPHRRNARRSAQEAAVVTAHTRRANAARVNMITLFLGYAWAPCPRR